MSVVPRVKNNGLYLGFLSLLSQTVHSSPTWCEELTYLKRPWCWERLRAGGEGDDRGWDGWMASPTQWTWVWVHSRSWWWTRRPGMLWFMGSQRVGHDWVTELSWTEYHLNYHIIIWIVTSLSLAFKVWPIDWPAALASPENVEYETWNETQLSVFKEALQVIHSNVGELLICIADKGVLWIEEAYTMGWKIYLWALITFLSRTQSIWFSSVC